MRNRRLGLARGIHEARGWAALAAWTILVLLVHAAGTPQGAAHPVLLGVGITSELFALIVALWPRRSLRAPAELIALPCARATIAPPRASEVRRAA